MSAALVNVVFVWGFWLSNCRAPWRRPDLIELASDGLHHVLRHAEMLPPQERPRLGVLRGIILLHDGKLDAAKRQLTSSIEELAAFREIEQVGVAGRWLLEVLAKEGSWREARALAQDLCERFAGQGMEKDLENVIRKAAAARTRSALRRALAEAPRVHCGLLTD